MTTTFVSVPWGRLKVVDEGGTHELPVVLLHAGIAALRSWDDVVPPLVSAGFRTVRYDARGFGASSAEDVEFSEHADLRCPVLAVAGQLDVSSAVQAARHLEAHARDARAVVLPHVAHMIGMETPAEFAELVVRFVAPFPRWS